MRIPTILKTHLATLVLTLLASTLAMAQFDDGQYQILQARYGTSRNNVDVTSRLKELARQDRTFRMGNSTFGFDPDPGVIKTLRIYARGRNRKSTRLNSSHVAISYAVFCLKKKKKKK